MIPSNGKPLCCYIFSQAQDFWHFTRLPHPAPPKSSLRKPTKKIPKVAQQIPVCLCNSVCRRVCARACQWACMRAGVWKSKTALKWGIKRLKCAGQGNKTGRDRQDTVCSTFALRAQRTVPARDFISCRYNIVLILPTRARQDPIFLSLDST